MTFNSLAFFIYLPLVWLVFYVCSQRWRWLVLLLSSYGFYAALGVYYLPAVLGGITLVTYFFGRWLGHEADSRRRGRIFWGGVGANLLLLVGLKYLPFLTSNTNLVFDLLGSEFHFFVPPVLAAIGASYFIFQSISYLADIQLEIIEPETHLGQFALYMAFFPKLLQGPIERAGEFLPQLKEEFHFNYDNMRSGLLLFGWGLFKKVVVADRLALYVNPVYADVQGHSGLVLVFATYAYALQLYCDFSGYTDMALGVGRFFNLKLTQNFNTPYLATSIADFWRRWHISFSRWILDYIFKPLQMHWRNQKNMGISLALMVTFVACGIWHGASWNFIAWGLLHGVYMSAAALYAPWQRKLKKKYPLLKHSAFKFWDMLVTFNLVCFAWIFFRAESLADASYIVTHLFADSYGLRHFFFAQGSVELAITLFSLLIMLGVYFGKKYLAYARDFFTSPLVFRWSVYWCMTMYLLLFNTDSQKAFIYFQF